MLKHLIKLLIFKILFLSLGLNNLYAVPAFPGLLKVTQPDGSVIKVYIRGDEYFSWWETEQGNISMKNEQTGYLEYAQIKNVDGIEELSLTGIRVSEVEEQARVLSSAPKITKSTLGRIWTEKRRKYRERFKKILQQGKDLENK